MSYTCLESCHWLVDRRPQFANCELRVSDGCQVRTADCGCENRTRLVGGRPSADGLTVLCDDHALDDDTHEESENETMIMYADSDTKAAKVLAANGATKEGYNPKVGWGQTGRWIVPADWHIGNRDDGQPLFRLPNGEVWTTYPGCQHYRGGSYLVEKATGVKSNQ